MSDFSTVIRDDVRVHEFSRLARMLEGASSRISLLSSRRGREIEELLWEQIRQLSVKVLSFDVFDTFLLRNNKPEALRYLEMSDLALQRLRKLFPDSENLNDLTPEDLCLARIMGMQATYRTRPLVQGCGEGVIEEVYAMQCLWLGLPSGAEDALLETEIDYEVQNLVPNPALMRLARKMRKEGGQVILVSDMYLRATHIEAIISRMLKGEKQYHDHLYSSADLVVSKRSGKIFPFLEKELGAAPEDFLHLGDSWVGDVEQPRKAGWNAEYFPVSRQELQERRKALEGFVRAMDEKGIETRVWAKI